MNHRLAVYVHIPFCTVKCGYCDFNAYAGMDLVKPGYGQALLSEVAAARPILADRVITSIGFGGGTPSEVPVSQIAEVLESLRRSAEFSPRVEVSLEANPGTVDAEELGGLRAAGVTRLSLGAQSFSSDELRFLDRIHSPEATDAAVRLARTAGFASVGLDLIYGLPGQTEKSWLATLNHACGLNPDHVSAYALTVEDATPLARKVRRGEVTLPEDDEIADLYEAASDFLGAEGFEHYELSNWARPGHQSRHNLTYWADGDYLGIGAGAHGYLQGERYENIADPREYIAALSAGSETPLPAAINRYRCDNQTSMSDWLGLRLRLIDGFASTEFADRFGMGLPEAVGPVVEECVAAGVLETDPRVRLTRKGRLLHGEVSARLLSYLSRSGAALAGAR